VLRESSPSSAILFLFWNLFKRMLAVGGSVCQQDFHKAEFVLCMPVEILLTTTRRAYAGANALN